MRHALCAGATGLILTAFAVLCSTVGGSSDFDCEKRAISATEVVDDKTPADEPAARIWPRIPTHTEAERVLDETTVQETTEEETEPAPAYRYFRIAGDELDRDLARYLQDEMKAHGIPEWWYEIALCQFYQESSFNANCLTPYPGGNDCGLIQFRDRYFPDYLREAGYTGSEDIMNPYIQIDVYCHFTARRLVREGKSIERTISDWMSGGYDDTILWFYVEDVFKWRDRLEEVR